MAAVDWETVPPSQPHPGVVAWRVDLEGATVVRYEFAPGASFPLHAHDEEQVLLVVEGRVEMREGDGVLKLFPGGAAVTPAGVPHGLVAPSTRAVVVNVIVPRRSGGVTYLPEPR